MDLSALATSCKGTGFKGFGYQVVLFRLKSVLPDCIGMVPLWSLTLLPKSCPRRDEDLLFTDTVGISASNLWSLYIQILSYQHYPAIAKHTYYLTESTSALHPCHNSDCSKDCPEVWFSYPLYHSHVQTLPQQRRSRYLEQFLAGPSSA